MHNLTVNPAFKIVLTGKRIVVSNEQAILIICTECGNTINVFLHHIPTDGQMENELLTGTVQYPMFKYCKCDVHTGGGDIHVVK